MLLFLPAPTHAARSNEMCRRSKVCGALPFISAATIHIAEVNTGFSLTLYLRHSIPLTQLLSNDQYKLTNVGLGVPWWGREQYIFISKSVSCG